MVSNRTLLFQASIFKGYVSFKEGIIQNQNKGPFLFLQVYIKRIRQTYDGLQQNVSSRPN